MRRAMNIVPGKSTSLVLAFLPFILLAFIYVMSSAERRAANPNDKLLPPVAEMAQSVKNLATVPSRRDGSLVLWEDTFASMKRLLLGIGLSAVTSLVMGLALGLLPLAGSTFNPLVAVISMVPPMAVLPVLFIIFGLGELSKVVLIIIGIAPFLTRDVVLSVNAIPSEQMIKAQTLGASTWQVALRVVLPQILPRLIESLRLALGPAFLFLISAEAIAAENGLGYRIFLVRRYLAMDTILPYVAWITLIAFALDQLLAFIARRGFSWAYIQEAR